MNSDAVSMDDDKGLVELDLATGEKRWVIDGDRSFEGPAEGVLRIAVGGREAQREVPGLGLHKDSSVGLLLPDLDLESEATFPLVLAFYTGENPLVLIGGPKSLPRPCLNFVVAQVEEPFHSLKGDGPYYELALKVKNMGLWVLQQSTRRIEQSVRDALDDEEFSPKDYSDLREYPARLARIERMAARLRDQEPEWTSAEPKSPYPLLSSIDALDFFTKHVDEAADDAREAVGRLSGLISSQQIVLSQRQSAETAHFQRLVTIVGAAVLVPGLVAATFGANVGFRGRESSGAFWAMLLLMAGSAIGSYAAIRFLESPTWKKVSAVQPATWVADLSIGVRLTFLGALAVILLAAGFVVLVGG